MEQHDVAGALETLAAKFDGLALTPQEQDVLDTVMERAAAADDPAEVVGFSAPTPQFVVAPDVPLTAGAMRWGRALGLPMRPEPDRYIGETEKN